MEPGSLRRSPGAGADARGAGGAGARNSHGSPLVGSRADHRAWRGGGDCGSIGLFRPFLKTVKRTVAPCDCAGVCTDSPWAPPLAGCRAVRASLSSRLPRAGPSPGELWLVPCTTQKLKKAAAASRSGFCPWAEAWTLSTPLCQRGYQAPTRLAGQSSLEGPRSWSWLGTSGAEPPSSQNSRFCVKDIPFP